MFTFITSHSSTVTPDGAENTRPFLCVLQWHLHDINPTGCALYLITDVLRVDVLVRHSELCSWLSCRLGLIIMQKIPCDWFNTQEVGANFSSDNYRKLKNDEK